MQCLTNIENSRCSGDQLRADLQNKGFKEQKEKHWSALIPFFEEMRQQTATNTKTININFLRSQLPKRKYSILPKILTYYPPLAVVTLSSTGWSRS